MMPSAIEGLISNPADVGAENQPSGATQALPRKPILVLRAVASGQIPGVVVPKGTPPIESGLTPEDIADMGVGIYRPQSGDLALALFNADQVPVETLQKMDAAGKLAEALPSITEFLDTPGAQAPAEGTPADAEEHPQRVPLTPVAPATGAVASQAAQARLKALTGNVAPSKRPMPGAGAILNGLLARPV